MKKPSPFWTFLLVWAAIILIGVALRVWTMVEP